MDSVLEQLSTVRIFEELSVDELEQLIQKSELKHFSEGDQIIKYGQSGRFLGVVLSGEVA